MVPQDVLDEFFRYVQNEIPIRLIYVKEMRLVDRYFVQQYYLGSIKTMTEKDVGTSVQSSTRVWRVSKMVQDVVKYDILSHRWLPQGEPTVRDMMDGTAAWTLGYAKLLKFCAAADSDFVWSDTYCIDKSSSSELDESIRSMFKWYRNSTTCIVHLAQTTRLADMGNDEWFERGWTLQELLAPRVIKFYNANWYPFMHGGANDKYNKKMTERLASATGCSGDEFRYLVPGPFKVDQRMSWAAKRKTTRAEDMAYSLMGMFDVIIQPAYGEGGGKSFLPTCQGDHVVE
ncbi:hypothetical protein QBC40DRAFT_17061 [Triangularia verruculosa]|uniref:Heterokaryon incompatibility domain-containing protein n=1 Tax=Triangularia verruculosa TaxID=2587418 RepID=A0AAN6XN51_9PEZI|nr:hypothetical protein QBC40DRAFT_17061 [Triangularia verruculosa]